MMGWALYTSSREVLILHITFFSCWLNCVDRLFPKVGVVYLLISKAPKLLTNVRICHFVVSYVVLLSLPSHLSCLGRLELREDTIESLLSASCLLQLSSVIQACCSFLMKQLHPSNCLGIRSYADAQGCHDLQRAAHSYTMVGAPPAIV